MRRNICGSWRTVLHREGSDEAEAFVEVYLRKLLEGKVGRVIGGIRQMATKRGLTQARRERVERYVELFRSGGDSK